MNYKMGDYELDVQQPWLGHIASGRKKVEGRLYNPKYTGWIGKKVRFYWGDESVYVTVIGVRHYPTLYAYLASEGHDQVLPGIKSFNEAVNIYHRFYSDARILDRGGMSAIEVSV